jgi:ribosomal peptide maturation radical SAM protein 1
MADTLPSSPRPATRFQAALVSMPWALFNRPSVQLGVLKSYLDLKAAWLHTETLHPYLETAARITTSAYHFLSGQMWAGEALYASTLFPELKIAVSGYLRQVLRQAEPSVRKGFDFDTTQVFLAGQLDELAGGRNWDQYLRVGFSVCANQLLASLAAAQAIKLRWPKATIVFGGSSCAAEMGVTLLASFSQIDYLVQGEGEQPLLQLCEFLADRRTELPAAVLGRQSSARPGPPLQMDNHKPASGSQFSDLASLPSPDYRDYFRQMQQCFANSPFIPVLPVEFSRGCWWGKCTFCNLNLQWQGYRAKPPQRMKAEVVELADRHACRLCHTDNCLPRKESAAFFAGMAELGRDFSFFGEVRASRHGAGQARQFSGYRRGGLSSMQVGIESLSQTLLARMRKGTTVLDNIVVMRDALDAGILLEGNLITEFPGSTAEQVEETLANLDFVLPFHPLKTAAFFLGHGSPVHQEPEHFGINVLTVHPLNRYLFPAPLLTSLHPLIKGFKGQRRRQKKLWQPVVSKVREWQKFHGQRRRGLLDQPPLCFRDGGGFLIIRQELPDRPILHHRLRGISREIYLYCQEVRSVSAIASRFPALDQQRLLDFLKE